jgi:hypothetical protein
LTNSSRVYRGSRGYIAALSNSRGCIEAVEVMSWLDQKNEASSRHSRFDQFVEAVSRQSRLCYGSVKKSRLHRGSRGYVMARLKNRGCIETVEVMSWLG